MVLHPRIKKQHLITCASSLLGFAQLAFGVVSVGAQEAAPPDAANGLVPIHLWVAGHTLPLRVSPLTDTRETFVPLTALAPTGAEFRLLPGGNAVHITARSGRTQDIPLVTLKGTAMLALSELAKVLDASVQTSATEPDGKPTFRRNDTVYLLAHLTDARFENGALHVRTSFPVPFNTRMLAEMRPTRGFVDCVGAEVSESFRPAPLRDGEKLALRLRTGQYSPTIARVVVELPDGVSIRSFDTNPGALELTVNTVGKPGAKLPEIVAAAAPRVKSSVPTPPIPRPDQADPTTPPIDPGAQGSNADASEQGASGGPATTTPTDPPANGTNPSPARPAPHPAEIRGLEVVTDSPSVLRFDVATDAKVRPIVRYSPGTTQMLVDIPNAQLKLADDQDREKSLSNPLISGVRMETFQGAKAPTTRLTLDTARILGYSLNVQQGSFSLELRLPRNATGVLSDKLIVVDAGHGGSATGATGGGICEKDCTLAIALKLRAELESCGARVIMTRTRDADVSLTDRSRMGNEIGADLFVSIHNDSNERSNSASGTSTYYHNSDPSSRALATCVQHSVMAITGLPSRGVLSDTVMYNSGFAVLRGSSMPAVLCEVAYINNQTDRRKLIDGQFQQRVAKAICDGLRSYVEGKPGHTRQAFARPMPDRGAMPTSEADSGPGSQDN